MTSDPHQLTGAYAADALDDELERRAFENHLVTCEECREEVRTLRETAAALSAGVARTPPAGLRLRVMSEIAQTAQEPPFLDDRGRRGARAQESPSAARRLVRRPAVAAAAALLVGGGLAGAGWYQSDQSRQALAQAQAQAQADRRQLEQVLSIVGAPDARRVSSSVAGGGTATVVRAGSRAAVLAAGLPALPSGRTYQLWLVRPAGMLSAGLGPQGSSGAERWNRVLDGLVEGDSVAISVEPDGGSTQPTTQPIAVLKT